MEEQEAAQSAAAEAAPSQEEVKPLAEVAPLSRTTTWYSYDFVYSDPSGQKQLPQSLLEGGLRLSLEGR